MTQAVTPRLTRTTTALLHWWFGQEAICLRGGHGFHDRQRQAIEDTIAAHEAMDPHTLRQERPIHRLALTDGIQQIEVLLALLVWQLLNHNDACAAGIEDARFTHQFIAVASQERTRERLRQVFFGLPRPGHPHQRDFGTSDLVRLSLRLAPHPRREEVLAFVLARACEGAEFNSRMQDHGVIALTDGRVETLECLARLPHAMVFEDDTRAPDLERGEDDLHGLAWRHHVRRFASARPGSGVQVVFTPRPGHDPGQP